jgi:hypothetical protein
MALGKVSSASNIPPDDSHAQNGINKSFFISLFAVAVSFHTQRHVVISCGIGPCRLVLAVVALQKSFEYQPMDSELSRVS